MSQSIQQKLESFFDVVVSQGKVDEADRYLSDSIVDHDPWPDQPATVDGFKAGLTAMRAGFPDLKAEVERVISEGDMAVAHLTFSGTHLGDFMGAPGSGKTFRVQAIDIVRMTDGRIAEHWGLLDDSGMAAQLGLA